MLPTFFSDERIKHILNIPLPVQTVKESTEEIKV